MPDERRGQPTIRFQRSRFHWTFSACVILLKSGVSAGFWLRGKSAAAYCRRHLSPL